MNHTQENRDGGQGHTGYSTPDMDGTERTKEHRIQSSYAQLTTITGHSNKGTGAAPDLHPASANSGIPVAKEH